MRRFLPIIFITGLILLSCKNPFKTRSSPEPTGPRGTFYPPTTPETVIDQNLKLAYNEKIIDNYLLCFSDSFIFSAPEDSVESISLNRPELFWNWNLTAEKNVTFAIFNLYTSGSKRLELLLSKNPDQPDVKGDTSAVLHRNYWLLLYDYSLSEPLIGKAQGLSTFYLKKSSYNLWDIYFWQDRPLTTGGYDWAKVKAEFRE